jgi:agmatine deiminase
MPTRQVTRRLPGEWEPHDCTVVAWPTRNTVWGEYQSLAEKEYAGLVRALAEDEPVVLICREADRSRVARFVGNGVRFVVHPIDDGWIRDNGPLVVRDQDANGQDRLVAVTFGFNSWGNRFNPTIGDLSVRSALADALSIPVEDASAEAVIEGGAISSNGSGAFLVGSECALTKTRNPNLDRRDFESILQNHLGARDVIWVPYGLLEDRAHTDGHVDNVAVFVNQQTVLVQTCDPENANYPRLELNARFLRSVAIDDGTPLEVIECPLLPYGTQPDGQQQAMPYINFVLTNESAILPSAGDHRLDEEAALLFQTIFPTRQIKFVRAVCMAYGGGGPHCVTMQIPRQLDSPGQSS